MKTEFEAYDKPMASKAFRCFSFVVILQYIIFMIPEHFNTEGQLCQKRNLIVLHSLLYCCGEPEYLG